MNRKVRHTDRIRENARACYQAFLTSRIEVALDQTDRNPQYKELCYKWESEEKDIELLLKKMDKEERIMIRRHYEELIEKENYELEEVYLQGMRDCMQLLSKLGLFSGREYI